jgi:hypothetical protein
MRASRNRRTPDRADAADMAEMLDIKGSSSSQKLLDDAEDFKIRVGMQIPLTAHLFYDLIMAFQCVSW